MPSLPNPHRPKPQHIHSLTDTHTQIQAHEQSEQDKHVGVLQNHRHDTSVPHANPTDVAGVP